MTASTRSSRVLSGGRLTVASKSSTTPSCNSILEIVTARGEKLARPASAFFLPIPRFRQPRKYDPLSTRAHHGNVRSFKNDGRNMDLIGQESS